MVKICLICFHARCEANSFTETKERRAYDALHMNVAAYFQPALSLDGKGKVIVTDLPPIYFQHQGIVFHFSLLPWC